MIDEFSLASPFIGSIVQRIKDGDLPDGFSKSVVHDIWTILQGSERMTLDQFIIKAYNTPCMLRFWADYASYLQLKPDQFSNSSFTEIRDELGIKEIVEEAYQIKYLTTETVDLIYESIDETETASVLTQEYKETKQGMFEDQSLIVGKLFNELDQV